jgi:predicted Fe-Mo cluster-binding NifX family protein
MMVFVPVRAREELTPIVLNVDEYEAIRLIDREGFLKSNAESICILPEQRFSRFMQSAAKNWPIRWLRDFLCESREGILHSCSGNSAAYGCRNCYQQKIHPMHKKPKGDHIMRIAVTYENGEIFQHFGHTEQFKIYDVEDGNIISSEVMDAGGSGHGALAGFLSALKVDVLICGGIGGGAQMALSDAGVRLYGGVSGSADVAAEALVAGELDFNPNVRCDHHDHHGKSLLRFPRLRSSHLRLK